MPLARNRRCGTGLTEHWADAVKSQSGVGAAQQADTRLQRRRFRYRRPCRATSRRRKHFLRQIEVQGAMGTDERSKSRGQACLHYALQGGRRRSQCRKSRMRGFVGGKCRVSARRSKPIPDCKRAVSRCPQRKAHRRHAEPVRNAAHIIMGGFVGCKTMCLYISARIGTCWRGW